MTAWLLADFDWKAVFPIAAFAIYVLHHVINAAAKGRQQQQQQQQQRRPAGPVQRPRPAQPVANPRRQELNDEVGEFLKKAAEKRGIRPPQGEAARAGAPRQQQAGPAAAGRPQARRSVEPVVAQAVEERPSGSRVAAQVQKNLNTQDFSQRASQLTNVDQADEMLESHLHQVFDHQLGQFAGLTSEATTAEVRPEGAASAAPSAAEALALLLANPQSLRGAVVLNEIFSRPEHRW